MMRFINRRLLQFSLKSLLVSTVVVAGVAAWFGSMLAVYRSEQEVVRRIYAGQNVGVHQKMLMKTQVGNYVDISCFL